ncbi:hypothetical protein [Rhodopirellula sp. P2]|uniref:hypothetical protein n=1 Tax=Rhodopirellula sp. P2 TaxID=2127060 RepID=UPI0023689A83|nr:hypothetical protein [Rhodopirellula sp. P2]WDQ16378.1 hypothetical protein PSR62_22545 [Rhodopirellula sp. P2]
MTGKPDETAAFLELLFGRCTPADGQIIWTPKSKSQTKRDFAVGSSGVITTAAQTMNGHRDHYIKTALMDAAAMRERAERDDKGNFIVGNLSEVKTVVCFALDCDAGKPGYLSRGEMLNLVNQMPKPPSMVVNSDGDRGGFHCYWCLEFPYRIRDDRERDYIADLARRWQQRLFKLTKGKLDATADLTRFLRVAGQPRSGDSVVSIDTIHPERLYSLRDLTIPWKRSKAVDKRADREIRKALGEPDIDMSDPITAYMVQADILIEDLLFDAGYEECKEEDAWIRSGSGTGGRSLKIATERNRRGVNVFSSADPLLPNRNDPGSFVSIEQCFINFRFEGDRNAAEAYCQNQLQKERAA